MDKLDVLLADLGQSMGMDELAFSDDECRLLIEDRAIDVIADRKRGRIIFTSLVAELPDGDRAKAIQILLDVNTGPTLGGPALGVPSGSDAVVLTDQIAVDQLPAQWLQARLISFVTAIDATRELLSGHDPHPPEHAAPEAGASSFMMRV